MAKDRDNGLLPPAQAETPCLVIEQAAVRHNLAKVLEICGGAERLVPHVKTHRAPWLIADLVRQGLAAFKAATPAEVEMVLDAGAAEVVWAYPSLNAGAIARVIVAARAHPAARVSALVHDVAGLEIWRRCLGPARPARVGLRVDLDPGMDRTGLPLGEAAAAMARVLAEDDLFAGWHLYDGHIGDTDIERRRARVTDLAARLSEFLGAAQPGPDARQVIVGSSYTFDLWPRSDGLRVSPGSWVYSSLRHGRDLPHLGWRQAAFVLTTVIRRTDADATLDAGAKAVGADLPLDTRFAWPGRIKLMSEEHTVVDGDGRALGERILLTPGHACTTAYLYPEAWVRDLGGDWQRRGQLGSRR